MAVAQEHAQIRATTGPAGSDLTERGPIKTTLVTQLHKMLYERKSQYKRTGFSQMHHFLCTTDDVIGTASGDEYAPSMGYVSNCAVAPSVEIYLRAIIKTGKDSYEKITLCAQKYCFNESDFNKRTNRLRTKSQSQLTTTGKGARRESQRREYPDAGTRAVTAQGPRTLPSEGSFRWQEGQLPQTPT